MLGLAVLKDGEHPLSEQSILEVLELFLYVYPRHWQVLSGENQQCPSRIPRVIILTYKIYY